MLKRSLKKEAEEHGLRNQPAVYLNNTIKQGRSLVLSRFGPDRADKGPSLFDVMATSVNITQDRITRQRMAGDPPDVLISPRLAYIGLLEFNRAGEAIEEGRRALQLMLPLLKDIIG